MIEESSWLLRSRSRLRSHPNDPIIRYRIDYRNGAIITVVSEFELVGLNRSPNEMQHDLSIRLDYKCEQNVQKPNGGSELEMGRLKIKGFIIRLGMTKNQIVVPNLEMVGSWVVGFRNPPNQIIPKKKSIANTVQLD